MAINVPDLIDLGRPTAEDRLDNLGLRYRALFKETNPPTGNVVAQSPAAGTRVGRYTVVTVTYSSPFDMGDNTILGRSPDGPLDGKISAVKVDQNGASLDFLINGDDAPTLELQLYSDADAAAADFPRAEWMRRGALLGLAQRAFTFGDHVQVQFDQAVVSIHLLKP